MAHTGVVWEAARWSDKVGQGVAKTKQCRSAGGWYFSSLSPGGLFHLHPLTGVTSNLELLRDTLKCCSFAEVVVGLGGVGELFTMVPNVRRVF